MYGNSDGQADTKENNFVILSFYLLLHKFNNEAYFGY